MKRMLLPSPLGSQGGGEGLCKRNPQLSHPTLVWGARASELLRVHISVERHHRNVSSTLRSLPANRKLLVGRQLRAPPQLDLRARNEPTLAHTQAPVRVGQPTNQALACRHHKLHVSVLRLAPPHLQPGALLQGPCSHVQAHLRELGPPDMTSPALWGHEKHVRVSTITPPDLQGAAVEGLAAPDLQAQVRVGRPTDGPCRQRIAKVTVNRRVGARVLVLTPEAHIKDAALVQLARRGAIANHRLAAEPLGAGPEVRRAILQRDGRGLLRRAALGPLEEQARR
mmetsp:Transcript_92544/g.288503  ORF Transcript_92544/g.288503 Transcript_92544/m.288503 type:complete len:283 (+) Transcript_92544:159-1007(+)